ncbi:MAG: SulP family inorganic anion transporter, partial [Candidatus Promineifilaceae bacterium]|nr:SulP family inorganic anion transporter [Candidatus Promineifilaceae bacterium]
MSSTALPGTPEYIMAASVLALIVGVFQLFLGLARLGVLVNFVSHSVIVGFASGAGVLILLKQIGPLLGLTSASEHIMESTMGLILDIPNAHLLTAAIGIGTIAFLVIARRVNPKLPAALLAMILSSLIVYPFRLDQQGVAVIGSLPSGFPPLTDFSGVNIDMVRDLLAGAVAVGAIGLVESTAIAKSVAAQTRQRLDSNQEFVGQGMANAITGLFSGYPVAGSFSRTAVNFRAGAQTRIAAVLASAFVLIAMQFLGPFARYLPRSALAGVLIVTAIGMIDRKEIMRILRGGRGDAVIMIVTFLGTLFLHIETAVLIGILLSFGRYIMRTSAPRVHTVVPDKSFNHFIYDPDQKDCPQLGIVEILGDLYFGAVNYVEDFILDMITKNPSQRYLLIRMHNVNNADFSGIHMLENIVDSYRERGGDVFLVRVSFRVRQRMKDTEFDKYLGESNFLDEDTAISQLFYRVLDPATCIYECPIRVFKECQNLPKRLDIIGFTLDRDQSLRDFTTIEANELWAIIREGNRIQLPMMIDVREPREFHKGHINGAHSIPLPTIADLDSSIATDHPIVLICRTGRRSRQAASMLYDNGYTNVSILKGGMLAWEPA